MPTITEIARLIGRTPNDLEDEGCTETCSIEPGDFTCICAGIHEAAATKIMGLFSRELAGERDARHKLEYALTEKDKAMGVRFDRISAAGVDCSDLIP